MKSSEELFEEAQSYYNRSRRDFYKAGGSLLLNQAVSPEGSVRKLLNDPEALQSTYEALNSLGFDEITLVGAGVFGALSVADKAYGKLEESNAKSRENAEMIRQALEESEESA